MNRIELQGNLGKDPEVTRTQGGTTVAKFSMATNRRVKKGEEWQDETTWHNVVCFGKLADLLTSNLRKGDTVHAIGRQEHKRYEKDGKQVYYSQVVVNDIVKVQYLRSTERVPDAVDISAQGHDADLPL